MFGDLTEDYYIGTGRNLNGTYNTSTVTDGMLEAELRIDAYTVSIILYENGTDKVKNGTVQNIVFPVAVKKTDGSTFHVDGIMYSGGDCIEIREDQSENIFANGDPALLTTSLSSALLEGNGELRVYITRKDQPASNYLFRVKSDNFAEIYAAEIALPIQESVYAEGERLFSEQEYGAAIFAYEALGQYKDSENRLKACRAAIRDMEYEKALTLQEAGEFKAALAAFEELGDYKDSSARTEELRAIRSAVGRADGKFGDIVVEVVADESTIYQVNILEQSETPGIGSLAVETLPNNIVEANTIAVDGVAAATVSSNAIKAAVADALSMMGLDPSKFGYVEPYIWKYNVYEAKARGSGNGIDGKIVVEVIADPGTIYEIKVLEQNETPGNGSVAVEKLPAAIVEANSLDVDGITGATVSSTGIKAAVREALSAMGFDPDSYNNSLETRDISSAYSIESGNGRFTEQGKGNGIDGHIVVEVTADANRIYEVTVIEQNETPGIGSVAVEKLPDRIVEANSVNIDGITGATVSSTAIQTAVREALVAMGFDPDSYKSID